MKLKAIEKKCSFFYFPIRFKAFEVSQKEINDLIDFWDRTTNTTRRPPSPSDKSELADDLHPPSGRKTKGKGKQEREKEEEKEKEARLHEEKLKEMEKEKRVRIFFMFVTF